jgi:hypothetical protein
VQSARAHDIVASPLWRHSPAHDAHPAAPVDLPAASPAGGAAAAVSFYAHGAAGLEPRRARSPALAAPAANRAAAQTRTAPKARSPRPWATIVFVISNAPSTRSYGGCGCRRRARGATEGRPSLARRCRRTLYVLTIMPVHDRIADDMHSCGAPAAGRDPAAPSETKAYMQECMRPHIPHRGPCACICPPLPPSGWQEPSGRPASFGA